LEIFSLGLKSIYLYYENNDYSAYWLVSATSHPMRKAMLSTTNNGKSKFLAEVI